MDIGHRTAAKLKLFTLLLSFVLIFPKSSKSKKDWIDRYTSKAEAIGYMLLQTLLRVSQSYVSHILNEPIGELRLHLVLQ